MICLADPVDAYPITYQKQTLLNAKTKKFHCQFGDLEYDLHKDHAVV